MGTDADNFDRIVAGQPAHSLWFGATRIDILGTAHVSKVSSRTVEELMRTFRYDCVALELCKPRMEGLTGKPPDLDLWEVMRSRRLGELTLMLAMSAYQQRIGERLNIEPGAEMKAAIECANGQGVPLLCVDRDVGVTLRRLSTAMPWWKRTVMMQLVIYNLFRRDEIREEQIEQLKNGDLLREMFSELPEGGEEIYDTLVFERDFHMVVKIMEYLKTHQCGRMLLVIGAGHLHGVQTIFTRYAFPEPLEKTQAFIEDLCHVRKRRKWLRILPWAIVALILFGFALGFDRGIGLSLVADWILINGGLAALGVLLAGGHIVTVICGFIAAPLTSINPLVGAGMVTAAVELTVRKPHVSALETLRTDTATWAGWRRNPIARTLLVFFFSTIGSAIGTYFGGFHIFSQLQ